jgi:hypothetical protein
MNRIRHIRRIALMLAGLAAVLLAGGATPAFAMVIPAGGGGIDSPANTGSGSAPAQLPPVIHTVTRVVVAGGMPGWETALIAAAAALLAAVLAVLADRVRVAHHRTALTAA